MESKKKNNVLIIVIIVLLAICGGVLGYIYGKKSITPKAKFVKVMSNYLEKNNIEDLEELFDGVYSVNTTNDFKISTDNEEVISGKLSINSVYKDDEQYTEVSFGDGSNSLTGNIYLKDSKAYIMLKDVFDKYYYMDMESDNTDYVGAYKELKNSAIKVIKEYFTDDKFTSKQIMKEHGLNVPNAILLNRSMNAQDREELLKEFYNHSLVVKPRNTNYGTGITVFAKSASKAQITNAVDYAFKFDENVLIEQYVKGMEYRFLVVNGKCLSVAHRRAASVVGNGKNTIRELIEAKNKEPWHYLTGTPVKMDEPVVEYLKVQGYDYETVLPAGKRVFLRTNSNCSTGGESVDMTEIMPTYFKKVAEKASRAFDAKICGVDIIIEDLDKENYSIIEINDNPGYSINEWPYEGKGEKIGVAILKLLNLLPEE